MRAPRPQFTCAIADCLVQEGIATFHSELQNKNRPSVATSACPHSAQSLPQDSVIYYPATGRSPSRSPYTKRFPALATAWLQFSEFSCRARGRFRSPHGIGDFTPPPTGGPSGQRRWHDYPPPRQRTSNRTSKEMGADLKLLSGDLVGRFSKVAGR